jgi:hypothetical protein
MTRSSEVKTAAAHRWVSAVHADGSFGLWVYEMAKRMMQVNEIVERAAGRR